MNTPASPQSPPTASLVAVDRPAAVDVRRLQTRPRGTIPFPTAPFGSLLTSTATRPISPRAWAARQREVARFANTRTSLAPVALLTNSAGLRASATNLRTSSPGSGRVVTFGLRHRFRAALPHANLCRRESLTGCVRPSFLPGRFRITHGFRHWD